MLAADLAWTHRFRLPSAPSFAKRLLDEEAIGLPPLAIVDRDSDGDCEDEEEDPRKSATPAVASTARHAAVTAFDERRRRRWW
mmetsp:Transcript_3435/g.8074  ORF Transcript_3435/g.8074 Transcript_3435/m.8074 type:complete len:83 (+) Transcript_3435:1053-1301(+)